jgi:outer membrane protein assembly factor BamA
MALGTMLLTSTPPVRAQDPPPQTEKSAAQTEPKKDAPKKKEKRGEIVVAPIPIVSPALGSGAVIAAGYIFPFSKNDKISPPSVIGVAALFTNNGTRGFALGGQFYLKENTYKITLGYGRGNLDYNLFGAGAFSGFKLPLKQTGEVFHAEFLRRIGWDFFLGPRISTGTSFLTVNATNINNQPIPPDLGISTSLTAIGIQLTRDTSVNRFYPTNGSYFTFTSDFYSGILGSKYTFQSYKISYNKYWSLTKKQILAANASFCGTGGGAPFYGNCIYGTNNELRGYVAGNYFDQYMLAAQAEYRLELPKRLGLVLFGGVGGVIPGSNPLLFKNSAFLPSGGAGLRFLLSKQYHVNLRGDIAQGINGHTFSMGIGEAF